MIKAQSRSTVSQETASRIEEILRQGEFRPGDRLPGERELAKRLRVGRTSVREAIRRLETLGIVECRQGLGTFVQDPSSGTIRASLAPHILADEQVRDKVFELRMIIEVEAAARAAESASDHQIDRLQALKEEVEICSARRDHEGIVIADFEFHREILNATGNEIMVNLMDGIMDLLRDMRRIGATISELVPERIESHRSIVRAIENRDSEAARRAMKVHLENVYTHIQSNRAEKSQK